MAVMQSEVQVAINGATAMITARQRVRELAVQVGLSNTDSVIVATVVSELARNIIAYATRGEIILRAIRNGHAEGLEVVAVDEGPGIVGCRACAAGWVLDVRRSRFGATRGAPAHGRVPHLVRARQGHRRHG